MQQDNNQAFQCEIVENLAVIYTNPKSGWTREVNRVSFNGGAPRLDIRDWSPDHSKMGKGLSLTNADAAALRDVLNGLTL